MPDLSPLRILVCLLPLLLPALASAEEGDAAVYEAKCASCHGVDGTSDTPVGRAMKIPSLAELDLGEATPEAVCAKVRDVEKHAAILKKVEEADLLAACRHVKTLGGGS